MDGKQGLLESYKLLSGRRLVRRKLERLLQEEVGAAGANTTGDGFRRRRMRAKEVRGSLVQGLARDKAPARQAFQLLGIGLNVRTLGQQQQPAPTLHVTPVGDLVWLDRAVEDPGD